MSPSGLSAVAFAHHFAGNRGEIRRNQIRAVFEQSVNICNSAAVGQSGKIDRGQAGAVLEHTAHFGIVSATSEMSTLFNGNLFQVRKVLEHTVAVIGKDSVAHDDNILDISDCDVVIS